MKFQTMWNVSEHSGIKVKGVSLTEPDQVCPTIREILTRFGALPDVKEVLTGAYDSEEEALAALDMSFSSKEEAFEKAKQLADELTNKAHDDAGKAPKSEEGPIPSPPQDLEKEEPAPPVEPASLDKA